MKTILIIIGLLLLAFIVWYVMRGRAWLKTKPWAQSFFAWIEPIETALYKKSETLLVGRLMWVGGFFVTAYDSLAMFLPSLDLTPISNRVLSFVPDDMRPLVVSSALAGIGLLIGWLRKRTTKPLEVVAVPDDAPPAVAAAVDKVEAANAQAVAAATAAKAA